MSGIADIVCQTDSRQCRQFPADKWAGLNGGKDDSLVCSLLPRLRSRNFNPMTYHLAKIDWSVFGTGTFERDEFTYNTPRAEEMRRSEFRNVLRSVCIKHELRLRNLVYYGKTEWGENRRGHFNFLIGRHNTEKVSPEMLAASMQEFWTSAERCRGRAEIVPFNENWWLEGADYQCKYEYDARGEQLPINELRSEMLKKLMRRNAATL